MDKLIFGLVLITMVTIAIAACYIIVRIFVNIVVTLSNRPAPKQPEGRYHCPDSCNICGGVNEVTVRDSIDYRPIEMSTVCKNCGHEDYWAYGFFESGQHMVSKCRKYK
jgi:hypothetical protein